MQIIKKFLVTILLFVFSLLPANAQSGSFKQVIKNNNLDRSANISISIKDLKTGEEIYSKNPDRAQNPASTLKLLSFATSYDTLGENYTFQTSTYLDRQNNLYIKLAADPLLNSEDLAKLLEKTKQKINYGKVKKIFIDDTILPQIHYPKGWTNDDCLNIAPITPYIIDNNELSIKIAKSLDDNSINIIQNDKYKYSFINNLKIGNENSIQIFREYASSADIITLSGIISKDYTLILQARNPKQFFITRLENAFAKNKMPIKNRFNFKQTPQDARKIAQVEHTIQQVCATILKNSNNCASEILFALAGKKYNNCTTNCPQEIYQNALKMLENFYREAGINTDKMTIIDSSGVSRYSALSTNNLTDAIIYLNKNYNIRNFLTTANEGTLTKRLRYLENQLWAKTGTMRGLSSIAGIIKTKNEQELAFAIIIQDFTKSKSALKSIEDDLIDCMFNL